MPKLTELDGTFVGKQNDKGFVEQEGIDGAQGVLFDCPLCRRHSVLVWFKNPRNAPNVPDDLEPGPLRSVLSSSSTSLDNLTLTPSINLDTEEMKAHPEACKWHGFVTEGIAA